MTLDALKDIARFNMNWAVAAFEARGEEELDKHRALYDVTKCAMDIAHALREYNEASTVDKRVIVALMECITLQAKLVDEIYGE